MRQRKPLVPNDDEMYQREQSVHKYDEVIEQQLALWSQTAWLLYARYAGYAVLAMPTMRQQ